MSIDRMKVKQSELGNVVNKALGKAAIQEYKDAYILGKNDSITGVEDMSVCDNTP